MVEGRVVGAEVSYLVCPVTTGLCLTLVDASLGARYCVAVGDFLVVKVVGTVVTWVRHCGCATLMRSAANCIRVINKEKLANYAPRMSK